MTRRRVTLAWTKPDKWGTRNWKLIAGGKVIYEGICDRPVATSLPKLRRYLDRRAVTNDRKGGEG